MVEITFWGRPRAFKTSHWPDPKIQPLRMWMKNPPPPERRGLSLLSTSSLAITGLLGAPSPSMIWFWTVWGGEGLSVGKRITGSLARDVLMHPSLVAHSSPLVRRTGDNECSPPRQIDPLLPDRIFPYSLNHLWVEPPVHWMRIPPQQQVCPDIYSAWNMCRSEGQQVLLAPEQHSLSQAMHSSIRLPLACLYTQPLLCCLIWRQPFICRRNCLRAKETARSSRQFICIILTDSVYTPFTGCLSIIAPQPSEDVSVVTTLWFETTPIGTPSVRNVLSRQMCRALRYWAEMHTLLCRCLEVFNFREAVHLWKSLMNSSPKGTTAMTEAMRPSNLRHSWKETVSPDEADSQSSLNSLPSVQTGLPGKILNLGLNPVMSLTVLELKGSLDALFHKLIWFFRDLMKSL